ncbi:MAG: L-2-amino-thiazoline-4-carboxylic acid hydrolase [Deltaproteobacteria bacterium]|uniref:L-2-amino-thiazoline-4-carboxylic acid hydrolase n=1 Tax=Candidatus Zymogenus saltonus TaxID=2844893 RepID=A0A9D8KA65_9DELT|nr:L-2-amino-thiazoline-4-carboxylic acid hydrolase [Candidatus Zymogenus saltonus]
MDIKGDIKNLKNYDVPMNESTAAIPPRVIKVVERAAMGILRERLGLLRLMKLGLMMKSAEREFSAVDLGTVRERGLTDEAFIKNIILQSSAFCALTEMVGEEDALETSYEIAERTALELMSEILPSTSDFLALEKPLDAAKSYILALMEADKRAGLHENELVYDSADAFQINVTYCAFREIPRLLGVPKTALPSCYGDDVFFPQICGELGLRFVRKGALARGDDFCDFRFEVI